MDDRLANLIVAGLLQCDLPAGYKQELFEAAVQAGILEEAPPRLSDYMPLNIGTVRQDSESE